MNIKHLKVKNQFQAWQMVLLLLALLNLSSCGLFKHTKSDVDADGIVDKKDKCPNTAAGVSVDEHGCVIDSDGDGLTDDEDQCPYTAGLTSTFGCPDSDGDGFPDAEDLCPEIAGTFDGCPLADRDGDSVPDDEDFCPDEPGLPIDGGCPAVGAALDSTLMYEDIPNGSAGGETTTATEVYPINETSSLEESNAIHAEIPEIQAAPVVQPKASKYQAEIKAKKAMLLNKKYTVTVYVGQDSNKLQVASSNTTHVSAQTSFATHAKDYGSVELRISGGEVEIIPPEEACQEVKVGSFFPFTIIPKEAGNLDITAFIRLHKSNNCADAPTSEISGTLNIQVDVDVKKKWTERLNELIELTWNAFTEFYGAVLGILFGLLLFLLRKKLKKWFGYEEKES